MTLDEVAREVAALRAEVDALRAEGAARRLLGRYMFLCDAPLPEPGMSSSQRCEAIGELFSADAVWEGVGGTHGAQFGRKVGPAAIAAHMSDFFGGRAPAMAFNTHYLCTESLTASGDAAQGTWVQFQPWVFDDGSSVLRSSRLHVRFADTEDGWRITHYRTENLFVADLPAHWATSMISQSELMTPSSAGATS
jgi:hypothetical protein